MANSAATGIASHTMTADQLLTEIGYAITEYRRARTMHGASEIKPMDWIPEVAERHKQLTALRAEFVYRTRTPQVLHSPLAGVKLLRARVWVLDYDLDQVALPEGAAGSPTP
ncbi:hypothetical protein ACWDUL_33790 [Nocardia niigatensis]